MTDIKSLSLSELTQEIKKLGEPVYRAKQIFKWLHERGVYSFGEMTDISKGLREKLTEEYYIPEVIIEEKYVSKLDGTVKFLFRLYDGEYVEAVVMSYKYGKTICISTQVGCKMGCSFCASTLAGFKRNLLVSELEGQLHTAQNDIGERISHVVLMGIGEPLDNYDNVVKFLRLINDNDGLNISLRDVTLSTCGIVPRIYDLIEENLPVTLTLSLHAPNDELRSKIMPVNNKWGVDEAIGACRVYAEKTSRRVSFEYTLIGGVNDSKECALELAGKLRGFISHVNLIPVNEVIERGNKKSTENALINFQFTLKKHGINATIRRTLGSDINASCGQLRHRKKQDN
ncbi:MAG: 23S rRNA (adenine(2503)-C(2))-methyltransferase RlmN [Eubacterium sp.]|nr:23S rRNA (adenine(2503)-C(2))-methyltransferase RlmN [Eubacterium sp.]